MGRGIFQTRRLALREMEESDYPALCRILQDPEVMYAYEHAFSDEEAWAWLRRQRERYDKDGFGLWAVVEKATGRMVGQCGLTLQALGDGRREPEVGYLFEKGVWHRGYATEAARGCLDYAFYTLGLSRVCATIRDNNLPSQRVALRLGMERKGGFVKHYYGMDMPHLVFWASRPGEGS